MANKNDVLVVAYYKDEGAAEAAAKSLKNWDDANDAIKLGAIAVLTLDPKSGDIDAKEVGQRNTKSGALWGTAIGAVVGILSGGIGLIPGLALGAGGGAAVGAMSHKGIGMTDEDRTEMTKNLSGGGAALAVMADDFEVKATQAEMVSAGGKVDAFEVPDETVDAITAAADAQTDATDAVDETVAGDTEEAAEAERTVSIELPDLTPEDEAAIAALVAATNLSTEDAAKIHEVDINKASELLEMAATPEGRQELSDETGIAPEEILAAVKILDLMRLKGVGVKYASLLLVTGVDTVPELAQRNPENLRAAMGDVNAADDIVAEMPYEKTVAGWVDQAKELPRIITY